MARGRPLRYLTWALPVGSEDAGVYAIECTVTGKVYVGASENIKNTIAQQRHKLQKGTHACQDMQVDYLVLGPQAFQVKLLEGWKEWRGSEEREEREGEEGGGEGVHEYTHESLTKCKKKWMRSYMYEERGPELYNKPHHRTLAKEERGGGDDDDGGEG